ncbi:MAG: TonB-dependent siderophore receptor [Planctomycetes bacterium]|nr:TonB-dependent siderophore receptor [Planctomycetota bacterium]
MKNLLWGMCLSVLLFGQVFAGETAPKKDEKAAEKSELTKMSDDNSKTLTIRGKKIEDEAKEESSYLPEETTSALKIPMKITEAPMSVQIITPELIEDQDAFRLQDVLRNVAGVSAEKNESKGQEYETASIRGFSQRLYRSGLHTLGSNTIDMSTVERVEVIKGPDAVTFGEAEPGGIINVVTKGAHLSPYKTKVSTTAGSYDNYRMSLDTGGALPNSDSLAFRLNLSYVNKDSFRDYIDQESYSIAPAFLWKIGDKTTLDIRVSHKHEERMLDPGVYFDVNHNPVASINTFLGDPNSDGIEIDDSFFDITLSHEFTPWLSMRTHVIHHDLDVDLEAVRIRGNPDANNMVARRYDASDIRVKEWAISNDFIAKCENDIVSNKFLLGTEVRHISKNWHSMQDNTLSKISITNPSSNLDLDKLKIVDGGDDDAELDVVSFYLQDTATLFDDKLNLMFGYRHDKGYALNDSATNTTTDGDAIGDSWQFGALYKLFPHFYPYLSVSTSFNPQNAGRVDTSGNNLDPETGLQYEGGFKSPFWDDKFTFTASAYRIDKENVAMRDPDNNNFYVNSGELMSRGFELTAQGDIFPNWSVIASYAYTDTEVKKSDTLPIGSRFQGIPLHSGSLWVVHTQREGRLSGLRLGGGLFAVGERVGDTADTFDLPGYATVSLMAGYQRDLGNERIMKAQLNVQNVLGKEYYETGSSYSFMPGSPRVANLTLGFEF